MEIEKISNEQYEMFWADQIAKEIISRNKYHFINRKIPKFGEFVVKTSASLSGVLHIGRLSDTIRGDSVHKALKDAGVKSKLIWVAEDMDPLRSIPQGVAKRFEDNIGMAVTDVPDPEGCHKSYAEHFTSQYFKVLDDFVHTKMQKFSMRAEYKKGSFKPYIKKILDKVNEVIEIQNNYRSAPLRQDWSPWMPVCDNCGKIVTPRITGFANKKVLYVCKDYSFEKYTAHGCNYEGENNPLKGNGKLVWKSEWAAQWARWKVVSEGAGKEYQVPNSAFWINGEITEKIFDYPAPVPIFYEHVLIDNVKMSASIGNVIYPYEWLDVASPELLRMFYNKRLMKARSFSWKDLPNLYDEYDYYGKVYFGEIMLENKKEEGHIKRLFKISHIGEIKKPVDTSFSHTALLAQLFTKKSDIVNSLKKTGHYRKEQEKQIFQRISYVKNWLAKYAPEEVRIKVNDAVPKNLDLNEKEKEALHITARALKEEDFDEKTLFERFYSICQELGLDPKYFFRASYKVIMNRDRGPKLAPFILTIGKEKVIKLFEKV